ncbi:MAG: putative toxin-antitoxin system toxin component, PIN family [Bacilli bacterium]|nr:putative toxin-antitoxin system toxin component, PIN family [Bacilli bacterium]
MNFVLDTNVIISAFYSQSSKPYDVLTYAFSKGNFLYYTLGIYIEYEDVLNREEFKFRKNEIILFLNLLTKVGILVNNIDYHFSDKMIDEDDRQFYELAKSYDCYLITGNKKHYPKDSIVLSPDEFINKLQMSA